MRRLLALALLFVCAPAVAGAASGERPLEIELHIGSRAELARLTRLVSIEAVEGLEVRASASPRQLEALAAAGYEWQVVAPPTTEATATMCADGWADDPGRAWDCYPSYDQYVALLERLAAQHPALCRVVEIGATTNLVRPHALLALEISDRVSAEEEDEPEVFLTSTMHGDETLGYILLLRLATELLESYGDDPELTALVDGVELWLNPLANPDGTFYASDASVTGAIRYYTTASGGSSWVDPNRNFPDPEDGDHPDGYPWWAETEAMMRFAEAHSFALSANFHGGSEVVNYPWDTWARLHADDEWFVALSRAYADLTHDDGPAGYMRDLDDGITNGYAWYEVAGGRQDYMTYFRRGRELTIEVSAVKLLPASELETMWQANRRALLRLVSEALRGVRGLVVDPEGRPLEATVEVVGHDVAADASTVRTDPEVGDYHRLLLPGTYTLRYTAPGFLAHEVGGVAVVDGEATRVDVVLHPSSAVDVSGVVSSSAGGPVAGATVELVDLVLAPATTGADGGYLIEGVPEGEHEVIVSAPGYATLETTRRVAADAAIHDFVLAPAFRVVPTPTRLAPAGRARLQSD